MKKTCLQSKGNCQTFRWVEFGEILKIVLSKWLKNIIWLWLQQLTALPPTLATKLANHQGDLLRSISAGELLPDTVYEVLHPAVRSKP